MPGHVVERAPQPSCPLFVSVSVKIPRWVTVFGLVSIVLFVRAAQRGGVADAESQSAIISAMQFPAVLKISVQEITKGYFIDNVKVAKMGK